MLMQTNLKSITFQIFGATNSVNFGKSAAGCSPVWATEDDIRPVSWSRLYCSIINAQNSSYNLHPIQAELAHLKHSVLLASTVIII